jgi:leucyl aminopeptidase
MKLTFKKGDIDSAPKGYVRVLLTTEAKGTKKLVRESGVETLEIGAGKTGEMSARKFITLCRAIVQAAKVNKAKKIAIQFDKTPELFKNLQKLSPEHLSQLAAENFEMANFEFTTFKTEPKEGWNSVEEILLYGKSSSPIEKAVQKGQVIGKGVNACRELANTPAGDMTPANLATAAKKAVKGLPVSVKTFKREEIAKMGMGLLAGVGAGSTNGPTFTIMKYNGGKSGEKPIVLLSLIHI